MSQDDLEKAAEEFGPIKLSPLERSASKAGALWAEKHSPKVLALADALMWYQLNYTADTLTVVNRRFEEALSAWGKE